MMLLNQYDHWCYSIFPRTNRSSFSAHTYTSLQLNILNSKLLLFKHYSFGLLSDSLSYEEENERSVFWISHSLFNLLVINPFGISIVINKNSFSFRIQQKKIPKSARSQDLPYIFSSDKCTFSNSEISTCNAPVATN